MTRRGVVRGSSTFLLVGGLAVLIFCVALFQLRSNGDDSSASPSSTTAPAANTTTVERLGVDGYGAVMLSVSSPSKGQQSFCALLASTNEQKAKGMMGRKDLGGYDAMIFPFPEDTTSQFFMANVSIALSVAFFKDDGAFVSSTDMAPCSTAASQCPRYSAAGPYRTAIEVLQGGFPALGIGSDAKVSYGGPCA